MIEGTEQEGPEEITLEEKTRQTIKRNQKELTYRIETGVLDPRYYELNYLWYLRQMNQPVDREDLGNQALVITQTELEVLGYLEIVLATGEIREIDPDDTGYEPDDPLIIFPEDLGPRPASS